MVASAATPPFPLSHQLTRELDGPARHVPGHVRVPLDQRSRVWDLRIAQDPSLCLVPPDINREQFCEFTSSLTGIADRDVSLRYAYGEIRLTRLNFYAPFFLGKLHFQSVEYQYGTYFARFYGPILFVIGIVSVVLSGLQAVVSVGANPGKTWPMAAAVWISVTAIVASCSLLFALGLLLIFKLAKEWKFAIRDRLRLL